MDKAGWPQGIWANRGKGGSDKDDGRQSGLIQRLSGCWVGVGHCFSRKRHGNQDLFPHLRDHRRNLWRSNGEQENSDDSRCPCNHRAGSCSVRMNRNSLYFKMHCHCKLFAPAMIKSIVLAWAASHTLLAPTGALAAQVFKCNLNGATHYQQSPCQASQPRERPTVDELNAERQRQLAQPNEKPSSTKIQARPIVNSAPADDSGAKAASSLRSSFKCDSRKYCTQMTSCAEAKYFLSNCAGVKMDGDGDGTPCEDQLCGH
jgi:hypothetical protein